jgi:hypothetical protein
VSYYHHAALSPRFRRIDGTWYCQLGVDYCFTRDGKAESSFADTLTAGIKRLERHPAVRGWTTMWETYLQGDLLTDALLRFGSLLTFPVDRGIDEAWWGPAPLASADEEPAEADTGADVDEILRQADVDQDDLRLLLEDEAPTRSGPGRREQGTRGSRPMYGQVRRPGQRQDNRSST